MVSQARGTALLLAAHRSNAQNGHHDAAAFHVDGPGQVTLYQEDACCRQCFATADALHHRGADDGDASFCRTVSVGWTLELP